MKRGYWLAAVPCSHFCFLMAVGSHSDIQYKRYMQGDATVAVAGARIRMYVKCCVIQPTPKLKINKKPRAYYYRHAKIRTAHHLPLLFTSQVGKDTFFHTIYV